jgi:uncharacterized protein YndB with AHSA1/START domain
MTASSTEASELTDRVLVIERIFDAPRSLVFKAWTEPQHLVRWYGPRGFTTPSYNMDLRPGGVWRACMLSPEGREYWVHGVFREIVEPERLVFTYAHESGHENEVGTPGHETVVTVTFAADGDKTRLTLHQAIFESFAARDAHRGGWSGALDCLAEYLVPRAEIDGR